MRAQRLLTKVLVALCALAAMLAVSCVPAGAEVTHKYLSSITEVPAEGPKGEPVALPGLLSEVSSMTLDEGKLYVAEQFGSFGTSRVDVFDAATRAFVRQFDQPAAPVDAAQIGIAVGHATGEPQIYVGALGQTSTVVVPFDAEGHQLGSPWVGEDTPAGSFSGHEEGQLADVAVDNNPTSLLGDWAAGDVFVDTWSEILHVFTAMNVIDVFKPEAGGKEKYVTQLTGTCAAPGTCAGEVVPFNGPSKVAVDPRNGDLLVVDRDAEGVNELVDMFRPGPLADEYEYAGSVTGSPHGAFHEIEGIAIDGGEGGFAEGAFYVLSEGAVYQFDATGRYVGRFSAGSGASSIAVDPSTHDVYVGTPDAIDEESQVRIFGPSLLLPDVTTKPASSVAPESATLNGTVNPDNASAGQTTCQFVWGTSESFGHVKQCAAPVAEGGSPVAVSVALEGLEPDTTYYYRLQASNGNGTNEGEASQTLHFTTPGPGIAEESAFGVSSTSATLAASINPHGGSTTYYFQYGTTPAYGTDVPAAPGDFVGGGEGAVAVTRHLQDLLPSTSYHYRVAVTSEVELEPGVFKEMVFNGPDRTFTTQQRGESLVLPDGRAWEQVSPVNKHGAFIVRQDFAEASKFGDGLEYEASSPTETEPLGYAEGEQVLSTRDPQGWSSRDISLPHRVSPGTALLHGGNFRFFSEDLSLGLAEPTGEFTSLVPEATPPDTERTLYLRHNDTCIAEPRTCYLPLVTGAPGYADVPPGTVLDPQPGDAFNKNIEFVGATPDLQHVLIATQHALTSTPIGGRGFYEWSAGKPPSEELQLITGEEGPRRGLPAISKDGSHIIFEAADGHLDESDAQNGETIQLDEVQSGASGKGAASPTLRATNGDDSVVYFTDEQKLTKDAGARATSGAAELYECQIHIVAGTAKCDLTDVTPETDANVVGVLGASEDASYVYFIATGVLSTQPNDSGERAVAGAFNLYESHNGTIEFVTVSPPGEAARVSPNGRYLAFESYQSLTGYDNVDVNTGEPDQEVFLFDAATGRIACVSCNPSGARPEAVESEVEREDNVATPTRAASIPGWRVYDPGERRALYQPRYLSDGGRLFFDSTDALVTQDVNKQEDVYEYEPTGIGDCQASSPRYEEGVSGCVGLISSGTAKGESSFVDASENGDDVFFLTNERLAGSDVDIALDVYDAHVCSTMAPCANVPSAPPPCTTADACRAAPSPQPGIFGSPASATFAGAGNLTAQPARSTAPKSRPLTGAQKLARALKACRHRTKRRRAACERKARMQYSGKQARRARTGKGGRG